MRRIIIASGDLNNIGDFALLMQCVRGLRSIDAERPIFVRQWATLARNILEELERERISLLHGKNILTSFKAAIGGLVMIGGGQMVRDNASLKSTAGLAAMMEIARRTGGITAVLGCGVSKLNRPAHRLLWKRILSTASVVTTRDDASEAEVRNLCGPSVTPFLTADLVFSQSSLHDALTVQSTRARTIIVAPCDDRSEGRCIDVNALADLTVAATEAFSVGTVNLVSHDIRPSMDPNVCGALEKAIRARAPTLDIVQLASNRLTDYTESYSASALVITNRLHAAIFAMLAHKPLLILDDGGAKTIAAAHRFDIATIHIAENGSTAPFERLLREASLGPPVRRTTQIKAAMKASAQNFELLGAALGACR